MQLHVWKQKHTPTYTHSFQYLSQIRIHTKNTHEHNYKQHTQNSLTDE